MSCQIFIKNYKGQKRAVCVNSEEELKNMTVKEFVRRFCPEEEDLYRCSYISDGRPLEGDHTLDYYGIKHGSTIHNMMILDGYGGGGPDEDEDEDEDGDEDEDEDGDGDGDGDEDGDEDEGMSRTESMDILADMQQTEPESSSCCML